MYRNPRERASVAPCTSIWYIRVIIGQKESAFASIDVIDVFDLYTCDEVGDEFHSEKRKNIHAQCLVPPPKGDLG